MIICTIGVEKSNIKIRARFIGSSSVNTLVTRLTWLDFDSYTDFFSNTEKTAATTKKSGV